MLPDSLIQLVIRPPRAAYTEEDLLPEEFTVGGRAYRRADTTLRNPRGQKLVCSHYGPLRWPRGSQLPAVIYCHGNAGSRAEAGAVALNLLPLGVSVFAFDFSGCGQSQGEWVSLGAYEVEDLAAVVAHLRADGRSSTIAVWGRSMGAYVALAYAHRDASIAAIIADSPFSKLETLIHEIVRANVGSALPNFAVGAAVGLLRRSIKSKAAFDILTLDALALAPACFVPALFAAGRSDTFIVPRHSQDIQKIYAGPSNFVQFEGDHNSERPQFFLDSACCFLHATMGLAAAAVEGPLERVAPALLLGAPHTGLCAAAAAGEAEVEEEEYERAASEHMEDALLAHALALSLAEHQAKTRAQALPSATGPDPSPAPPPPAPPPPRLPPAPDPSSWAMTGGQVLSDAELAMLFAAIDASDAASPSRPATASSPRQGQWQGQQLSPAAAASVPSSLLCGPRAREPAASGGLEGWPPRPSSAQPPPLFGGSAAVAEASNHQHHNYHHQPSATNGGWPAASPEPASGRGGTGTAAPMAVGPAGAALLARAAASSYEEDLAAAIAASLLDTGPDGGDPDGGAGGRGGSIAGVPSPLAPVASPGHAQSLARGHDTAVGDTGGARGGDGVSWPGGSLI